MAGNALHVINGDAKPTGMDAAFPGVISWKKFNRGNLPGIPNLKGPA
jgi:hypothetical protein